MTTAPIPVRTPFYTLPVSFATPETFDSMCFELLFFFDSDNSNRTIAFLVTEVSFLNDVMDRKTRHVVMVDAPDIAYKVATLEFELRPDRVYQVNRDKKNIDDTAEGDVFIIYEQILITRSQPIPCNH